MNMQEKMWWKMNVMEVYMKINEPGKCRRRCMGNVGERKVENECDGGVYFFLVQICEMYAWKCWFKSEEYMSKGVSKYL